MSETETLDANHERRIRALEAALPTMVPLAALNIFARDQHRFSNRPCGTCRTISEMAGKDWGCVAYAKSRRSS